MQQQIDEIKQAVRDIERNLLLLSTNASPDLAIAVEQGQGTMEKFSDFNMENIKDAI